MIRAKGAKTVRIQKEDSNFCINKRSERTSGLVGKRVKP